MHGLHPTDKKTKQATRDEFLLAVHNALTIPEIEQLRLGDLSAPKREDYLQREVGWS